MAPYETKMSYFQRGVTPILTNAVDKTRNPPTPRQKFVHFASKATDNDLNEFKTKPSDEGPKKYVIGPKVTNDSKRKRIPSSSELYEAGSSRSDLSSVHVQTSQRRMIREKPNDRHIRMESEFQNDTSFQNRQFKLVPATTPTQYLPRVPSPPVSRGPPPTPPPARLPTPDFADICDNPPIFCDCLGCYEAERSRRIVESSREASAYMKMEDQCEMIPPSRLFKANLGRSSSNCLHKG